MYICFTGKSTFSTSISNWFDWEKTSIYGQQEQNSAYVVDLVIDDADIIQHFDPHVIFKIVITQN